MDNAKDKESKATVDEKKKAKEKSLEVAGGKCWRGKWMRVLCFTGEILIKVSNESLIRNYQS